VTAALRLRRLTCRVGAAVVVDAVDLDVEAGERVAVVGGRSSGRSALLRMIATLVTPSAGELDVGGLDAIRQPLLARAQVAFVDSLLVGAAGLTVREYLQFVAACPRARRAQPPVDVNTAVSRLALPDRAEVEALAPSLQRRLAAGAALMMRSQVVVLDDALSDVDAATTSCIAEWIADLCAEGLAVITGVPSADAVVCGDRVLMMIAGRLVAAVPAVASVQRPLATTGAV
jgi:ABC-2 type transport system ATP-binding protein